MRWPKANHLAAIVCLGVLIAELVLAGTARFLQSRPDSDGVDYLKLFIEFVFVEIVLGVLGLWASFRADAAAVAFADILLIVMVFAALILFGFRPVYLIFVLGAPPVFLTVAALDTARSSIGRKGSGHLHSS